MQVTSPSAVTTALQGLTGEGDLERYLLKIASAEAPHLIKPGGPETHLHVLPAPQPTSCLPTHRRHAGCRVVIYRLRGPPAAPRGQWVRRWRREVSVDLANRARTRIKKTKWCCEARREERAEKLRNWG